MISTSTPLPLSLLPSQIIRGGIFPFVGFFFVLGAVASGSLFSGERETERWKRTREGGGRQSANGETEGKLQGLINWRSG